MNFFQKNCNFQHSTSNNSHQQKITKIIKKMINNFKKFKKKINFMKKSIYKK